MTDGSHSALRVRQRCQDGVIASGKIEEPIVAAIVRPGDGACTDAQRPAICRMTKRVDVKVRHAVAGFVHDAARDRARGRLTLDAGSRRAHEADRGDGSKHPPSESGAHSRHFGKSDNDTVTAARWRAATSIVAKAEAV